MSGVQTSANAALFAVCVLYISRPWPIDSHFPNLFDDLQACEQLQIYAAA